MDSETGTPVLLPFGFLDTMMRKYGMIKPHPFSKHPEFFSKIVDVRQTLDDSYLATPLNVAQLESSLRFAWLANVSLC
jgi:hypothetical protein